MVWVGDRRVVRTVGVSRGRCPIFNRFVFGGEKLLAKVASDRFVEDFSRSISPVIGRFRRRYEFP